MNVLKRVKEAGRRANRHIRMILRKVSIFRRLNLSFMLLIISAAIFLTFFSFYKYSDEISKNIDKYISLLVQNAAMKIEDTMQEYTFSEDIPAGIYQGKLTINLSNIQR